MPIVPHTMHQVLLRSLIVSSTELSSSDLLTDEISKYQYTSLK